MELENRSFMQKDWVKFYKEKKAPSGPSTFAKFIASKNLKGNHLFDIGSGNGRDTYYLGKKYMTIGVDANSQPRTKKGILFIKSNIERLKDEFFRSADIIYTRFFLHSITQEQTERIIKNTTGYFCSEARAIGDEPKIYSEHKRNFVDPEWLLETLINENFEILHFEKRRGLAKYKNEDPLVIRVIAKKI